MDIREEFEKLPEIANLISESEAYFADESIYFCDNDFACGYLNGAWYAFQEQQKKIDAVFNAIEQSELHQDRTVFGIQDEIKELLK